MDLTTDHYESLLGDLYPGSKGTTELTSYAAFAGEQFTFTLNNIRETDDGKIILDINGGDLTAIDEVESGSSDDDILQRYLFYLWNTLTVVAERILI